jgi:G3E family GTPase
MFLHSFFKGDLHTDPTVGIQELLRAILVRTNFVPVVRHIIGWRGLKQSMAEKEFWSAKIHGFNGVFGLAFDSLEPSSEWIIGHFSLTYFPHPDEDLVERCSLQAVALTQAEDYLQRIRDFSVDPAFADLFKIGSFFLSVDTSGGSFSIAIEALSAMRCVSEAGIHLPRDGQMVELVAPGGYDQNFPSFDVASVFFSVLAASATFNLNQPPVYLGEHRSPGIQTFCTRTGLRLPVDDADVWNHRICLGYGDGPFVDLDAARGNAMFIKRWVSGEPLPEAFQRQLWWNANNIQGAATIDKKTLGIDERPPLILLTGFLGSGKTSFLRCFIEYQTQRSRFVAVIQNEIGAVGLDGKLLDYTVTEIDEGCVCCSLAGNLKRAVQSILSRFDPDFIIVETTGLANPFNLLSEINELEDLVRFDCTLTVVDALNVELTLSEHAIGAEQIRGADLLMLNKKDLVAPNQLQSITDQLRHLNPRAPIFFTVDGDLNPALILEVDDRQSSIEKQATQHGTHLHDGLWTQNIRFDRPLDQSAFLKAVGINP